MLAVLASDGEASPPARAAALAAMSGARLRNVPESWIQALTIVTASPSNPLIADALAAVRALNIPASKAGRLTEHLAALAANESLSRQTRVLALASLPGKNHMLAPQQFDVLVAALTDADGKTDEKVLATEALARAKLATDQLLALTKVIAHAGPIELDRLLPLFGQNNTDDVGQALLDALSQNPARQSFRPDLIRPAFASLSATLKEAVEKLLAELHQDAAAHAPSWIVSSHNSPAATSAAARPSFTAPRPLATLATPSAMSAAESGRISPRSARSVPTATSWRRSSSLAPASFAATNRSRSS